MNKLIIFTLLLLSSVYSLDFKVASYNVENLFDLHYDRTEYKEYIPNTKIHNKKSYKIKLQNISKTILDLNASIIALQEIESQKALNDLNNRLHYKYFKFIKKEKSAIGLAILSKYPIVNSKIITVNKYNNYDRDILKVSININNKLFIIYNNHWRSKRAKESKRIPYASALVKDIKTLTKNEDYVVVGDLNSNYDEFLTFKYDKKLNDTFGITGINQVLNTSKNGNILKFNKFLDDNSLVHYNLWLELNNKNRFSSKFKNHNNTPDNIIVSKALFDNKNISYIKNSFKVFNPNYLYKNNKIYRWNNKKRTGYSDHLPIIATFSTTKNQVNYIKDKKTFKNKISYLYTIDTLNQKIKIKNAIVIYKYKNSAILKQKNNRAILLYKKANSLNLGGVYDITIDSIDSYYNLKEIKSISNIKFKHKIESNIEEYYLDAKKINILDENYQNEIIKNLIGVYKKGYLYFSYKNNDFKIKLYFQKDIKKPKNNTTIEIKSGHLSKFKSQIQISIHKKSDYI